MKGPGPARIQYALVIRGPNRGRLKEACFIVPGGRIPMSQRGVPVSGIVLVRPLRLLHIISSPKHDFRTVG